MTCVCCSTETSNNLFAYIKGVKCKQTKRLPNKLQEDEVVWKVHVHGCDKKWHVLVYAVKFCTNKTFEQKCTNIYGKLQI